MSVTSEALPQARSSFGLGTIVRLLAIGLGIVSVTILARRGLGFSFGAFTLSVLNLVEDVAGDVVRPLELLLIEPAMRWLSEMGWRVALQPHWKYIFALQWLYFAAYGRAWFSDKNLVKAAFRFATSALVAFATSVLAGFAPTASMTLDWSILAGFFLHSCTIIGWDVVSGDMKIGYFWRWLAVAAIFLLLAIFQVNFTVKNAPHLSLVLVGVIMLLIACIELLPTPYDNRGQNYFDRPGTRTGIDVLAVLGGAAAVVAINQLLV